MLKGCPVQAIGIRWTIDRLPTRNSRERVAPPRSCHIRRETMHKSRLGGIIIDCRTDDLDSAAAFWGGALGWPEQPREGNDRYAVFETPPNETVVEVQRVDHGSRVHIDIEADDIDAEATRLEALGARRVEAVRTWLVMEAPTGQRFCVISPERPNFESEANVWD